jgi:hypothetical protein
MCTKIIVLNITSSRYSLVHHETTYTQNGPEEKAQKSAHTVKYKTSWCRYDKRNKIREYKRYTCHNN